VPPQDELVIVQQAPVPATSSDAATQTDVDEVAALRETVRHQQLNQQWLMAAVMAIQQRFLM
jgi:hypothetical protein